MQLWPEAEAGGRGSVWRGLPRFYVHSKIVWASEKVPVATVGSPELSGAI